MDISGNKGINSPGALDVLKSYIADQLTLRDLNISHLQFNKDNLHKFTSFLLEQFGKDWNLNTNLKNLYWDGDLSIDKPHAIDFMTKKIPNVYNLRLQTIYMCDVFTKAD